MDTSSLECVCVHDTTRPVALVTAKTGQLLETEFPLELGLEWFSAVVCLGSGKRSCIYLVKDL